MADAAIRNDAPTLRITEIFLSLQGESTTTGWPTVFVRTTGCPLRCEYCDTAYAFTGGETMTLTEIGARVNEYGVQHVTVTGGEPLAQPAVHALMRDLCDAGYQVSLETSGAIAIDAVDRRVMVVMDLKTPGSGELERNRMANLPALKPGDQIKFVITDRTDYEWSRSIAADYTGPAEILFSPAFESLTPATLADWIVADRLAVRFQLQLHKLLWGDVPGR